MSIKKSLYVFYVAAGCLLLVLGAFVVYWSQIAPLSTITFSVLVIIFGFYSVFTEHRALVKEAEKHPDNIENMSDRRFIELMLPPVALIMSAALLLVDTLIG